MCTQQTVQTENTAVTVVLAMNLLGALLASALIIFPALCAMRLFKTFKGVTVCALIISVVASIAGMLISLILATATGPTVVAVDLVIFIVSFIIGSIKNKRN